MTDRSLRHCVLSDVQISGVSFGEETQNIRNTNTVEVLIFNPNDPYIPSTVSVDLPHTAAADTGYNYCSHSSTSQMGVSHTHGVAC